MERNQRLRVRAVLLLFCVMVAIAMMGEVARQNWNTHDSLFAGQTESEIDTRAKTLLHQMTTEQKVGQLFFAVGATADEVSEFALGGCMPDGAQLRNRGQTEVSALVAELQNQAEIPLFIGAEEEGGEVNTLSRFRQLRATPYLSPKELMTTGGMPLIAADTVDKCEFLNSMGFNFLLAPVCHVTTAANAWMFDRSFGKTPDDTARYVETVVRNLNEQRVIGVLKHFPGYGNLPKQGNTELIVDNRTLEELQAADFLPFVRGVKAGAQAVMAGHTVAVAIDPYDPVSLSLRAHNLLRRQLDFDGVIVCDLGAEGIGAYGTGADLAVQAVKSGNDLLLTARYSEQIPAVVQAVSDGAISVARLNESVLRILRLKLRFGIITES